MNSIRLVGMFLALLNNRFESSSKEVAMEIRRRRFCFRLICAAALACLLCIGFSSASLAESDKLVVRVMTRNMDAGTDLNYVTAGGDFSTALQLTFEEVYLSNIPARAEQLAAEIASVKPDLIALQEVTFWAFPGPGGIPVVWDQLELLKSALAAQGQHYRVVVIQPLTDISIPITAEFTARFTDQNAILVRSDLPPGHLDIMGIESQLFLNHLPDFVPPIGPPIPIPNGWMAVDVKIRGARFKFVNTHLLSPVPEAVSPDLFALTSGLQRGQGQELLAALSSTGLPIILAGDFNSDAEVPQHPPDRTPTAQDIRDANYSDIWHVLKGSDPGYTWPLFFEDQLRVFNPTSPFERIDLIFSRGPVALAIEQTGTEPGPGPTGVFASDHVGVVADFSLENHRPDVPRGKK